MNTMMPTIFVIEDEPKIAQLLGKYLERENYTVAIFSDGAEVVDCVEAQSPSLLILDLMLPGKDGLTICREVRQFSQVPIIILTAKVEEIDRLIGLELGADDYVCKPFSPREIVARVKAILRRVQQSVVVATENVLNYRSVVLNVNKFECRVEGHRVDLTPVEFRMLQALIARPGNVLSRDRLMHAAYTDERIVTDRTIDTHIKNIRKKLSVFFENDNILHSIYGVGYKVE